MSTASLIADPEVLEFLADDSGLLAVADLIVATQISQGDRQHLQTVHQRPRLAWRRPSRRGSPSGGNPIFSHRGALATAVLVVFLAVLVPIAFALRSQIVDLISGEPAPPSVAETFRSWSWATDGSRLTGHPFAPYSQAVADKAVGVLRLHGPDGPVDLYAAPLVGGGKCFMLRITVKENPPEGIGRCDDSQGPRSDYSNPDAIVPWAVSFGQMPDAAFVLVRVFDAASVEVKFTDGSTMPLRIVDGFAVAAIPPDSIPPGSRPPVMVIARDSSGKVIASDPLRYMSGVG